ncbi:MAG: NUDIX domain-containing protein [Actinomycetota bacterium]
MDERPIRRAASVLCGRDGTDGLEVLVVERGPDSRFLAGYVAFPGGAVDRDDEVLGSRWFGDGGQAHRAAAIRELAEETGLALTSAGGVPAPEADHLGPVHASPPAPGDLPEICHWVAPLDTPVRFDARYFGASLDGSLDPVPDGGETAAAWWTTPGALLEAWAAGDARLYWPTYLTVLHVAGCSTLADLLGLRFETREPTPEEYATLPRSVMEER